MGEPLTLEVTLASPGSDLKLPTPVRKKLVGKLKPFPMPVGVFVKRASRLAGLGAALPPLLIYLLSFFLCKGMGERGQLDPLIAAFLPDAILAALAAVLLGMVYRK